MNDNTLFERQLGAMLRSYADGAPVEVDPAELAASIAQRDSRVVRILGVTFVRPPWLTPLVAIALLLLALAAAVVIGAQLLRVDKPVYTPLKIQAASFMSRRAWWCGRGAATRRPGAHRGRPQRIRQHEPELC